MPRGDDGGGGTAQCRSRRPRAGRCSPGGRARRAGRTGRRRPAGLAPSSCSIHSYGPARHGRAGSPEGPRGEPQRPRHPPRARRTSRLARPGRQGPRAASARCCSGSRQAGHSAGPGKALEPAPAKPHPPSSRSLGRPDVRCSGRDGLGFHPPSPPSRSPLRSAAILSRPAAMPAAASGCFAAVCTASTRSRRRSRR